MYSDNATPGTMIEKSGRSMDMKGLIINKL
jgi:hypothetical protein